MVRAFLGLSTMTSFTRLGPPGLPLRGIIYMKIQAWKSRSSPAP